MQARLRRPGVCLFCALAPRPFPATTHALSLHTSAPLWRQVPRSRKRRQASLKDLATGRPGVPDRFLIKSHVPLAVRDNTHPRQAVQRAIRLLPVMKESVLQSAMIENMGVSRQEAEALWDPFCKKMTYGLRRAFESNSTNPPDEEMAKLGMTLTAAFKERGEKGLKFQLEHTFLGHISATKHFAKNDFQNQKALADLRFPTEWYPATRRLQRKIILHVGPTNSGKTYHALKRLEEVERGVYAGPLRLLAHEVYTRLAAKGFVTGLLTGEERRTSNGSLLAAPSHMACTVEMIPLHMEMDVCVIDEIQMIGDVERGWAWTQAVLGVQAKELHLCGEARTVPLIRELAAAMGDEVQVNNYNRLTPLDMDSEPVGLDFRKLRKGDCIVAFSVMEIHAMRRQIQEKTGKKVAIVYGGLPPETRAQQARLFNEPDSGYDVLVASDAIGMGLNLSIKRIIFASVHKFNGFEERLLSIPHLKQIAGRAGRYKSAHDANKEAQQATQSLSTADAEPSTPESPTAVEQPSYHEDAPFEFADPLPGGGLVATIDARDMTFVQRCLKQEPEPIKTAGLFPPDSIIERFANYFPPKTPFSYILLRLHDISRIHPRFHMCVLKDQLAVADAIAQIDGLSVLDKITFCAAPTNVKSPEGLLVLRALAQTLANQKNGNLLDIEGMDWSLLDQPIKPDRDHLRHLESLHKALGLYLWLSYRFSGVFSTRALAFHAKGLVEEAIEKTLDALSNAQAFKRIRAKRANKVLQSIRDMDAEEQDANKVPEGSMHEPADVLDGAGDIFDGAQDGQPVEPVDVEREPGIEQAVDAESEPLREEQAST